LGEILDQQLVDIGSGRPASNKVETRRLDSRRLEKLKAALKSVRYADEMLRDLLTGE
jgi:signal-transduction protein with cAMP-binding, CBS, and nucleotidyltransferase domain